MHLPPLSPAPQRRDYLPWTRPPDSDPAFAAEQAALRSRLAEEAGAQIDPAAYVSPHARVFTEQLSLGPRTTLAAECLVRGTVAMGADCTVNPYASVHGKVTLGDGVRVASLATLAGMNHGTEDLSRPIFQQPCTEKGIRIGDGVWVGANVVVLDGVTVGEHSILAAGAVVTKDVPAWAIVGGNPARVLRDRRMPRPAKSSASAGADEALRAQILAHGARARAELPAILARCRRLDGADFVDQPGGASADRPLCDAIELAAMFERLDLIAPDPAERHALVARLGARQDPATGLFRAGEAGAKTAGGPTSLEDGISRYGVLAVGYALECLGAGLPHPVRAVAQLSPDALLAALEARPWAERAWTAGDWIDTVGTALYQNHRYHGIDATPQLSALLGWLTTRADARAGTWGRPTAEAGWLQPVNGFYRATRGTFAQFGVPVPRPREVIDTILHHARDPRHFAPDRGTACNVLDIIHPLWLCGREVPDYRADEIRALARTHWNRLHSRWQPGTGHSFELEIRAGEGWGFSPGLQGTEMWLSIAWLCADLLGESAALGYRPRAVHRPEPGAFTQPV
jgi:acetyltransferase-like isoleucine patch superfamily enzyme